MSTPTAEQIKTLLDFLDEHKSLAQGNLRSVEGRQHPLWDQICTTLNAMGGCIKTTKQWQKVWTDKKYLAKKAAAAVRRSATATGGRPSVVPHLSEMELQVISIMGDGFGERQTSAMVPAFYEDVTMPEISTAISTSSGLGDSNDLNDQEMQVQPIPQATLPVSDSSIMNTQSSQSSTTRRRVFRRQGFTGITDHQSDTSVRDRLFQYEERRLKCDEDRNLQLANLTNEVAGLRRANEEISRQLELIREKFP